MSDAEDETDDVKIIEADFSLLNKIGRGNLDRLLSFEMVNHAEKIVIDATNNFYQDCVDDSLKLQALIGGLKPTDTPQVMTLKAVISKAFAIKTKSGQAGFDLVSELARSLHVLCEEKMESPLAAPVLKIIAWHGRSINHLLAAKITGDGGETGKAILAEIEGLSIASL